MVSDESEIFPIEDYFEFGKKLGYLIRQIVYNHYSIVVVNWDHLYQQFGIIEINYLL